MVIGGVVVAGRGIYALVQSEDGISRESILPTIAILTALLAALMIGGGIVLIVLSWVTVFLFDLIDPSGYTLRDSSTNGQMNEWLYNASQNSTDPLVTIILAGIIPLAIFLLSIGLVKITSENSDSEKR